LMRKVIGTAPSIAGPLISLSRIGSAVACAGKYAEITPAAAVVPLVFKNFRRDRSTSAMIVPFFNHHFCAMDFSRV
jgi:hypothetical protein